MSEEQRLPYMRLAREGVAFLQSLEHYLNAFAGLDAVLLAIVRLRVSQLNGCEYCIGLHRRELEQLHEPSSLVEAVSGWQSSKAFTHRQRAALRWAEEVTDTVHSRASDAAYAELKLHFEDKEMVDLTLAISSINAWNRLGVAFRTPWRPRVENAATAGSLHQPREADETFRIRPSQPEVEKP